MQRIAKDFVPDYEAFRLFRLAFEGVSKGHSKMMKWRCGCTTVQCATSLDATCGQCGGSFNRQL